MFDRIILCLTSQLKPSLRLHLSLPLHNVVLKTDFMPHVQVAEKTPTHPLTHSATTVCWQTLWSEQRAELSAAINCIDVDIGSDSMTHLVTRGTGGNIE